MVLVGKSGPITDPLNFFSNRKWRGLMKGSFPSAKEGVKRSYFGRESTRRRSLFRLGELVHSPSRNGVLYFGHGPLLIGSDR